MIRNITNSTFSLAQTSIPLHLREVSHQLQALTSRITASTTYLLGNFISLASTSYSSLQDIADRFITIDALSAATALAILDKFSLEELKDVLSRSQFLLAERMSYTSRAGIITAVAVSAIDQRENVLAHIRPLITESMSSIDRAWLIRVLAEQNINSRGYFLASKFFTIIPDNMPDIEKQAMALTIDSISVEDRGEIFAYTEIFISNRMNGFERKAIMMAVAAISSIERIEVLSFARHLVSDNMRGDEKELVIRAITAISTGDRREIFACAQVFITEEMSGFEISDIISIIGRLSSDVRIRIQLIVEDMSDFARAEVLQRLGQRQRPFLQNVLAYETLIRQSLRKNTAARKLCFTKQIISR